MAQNAMLQTDGSGGKHPAADLDTIVVDPEDVLEMQRRNHRDANENRSHVLRVTPPLKGERKASLHVSEDYTFYPPDMSVEPLHIGERTLFAGGPDRQMDPALKYPDVEVDRQEFESHAEDDVEWEEWREVSLDVWESNVRNAMEGSREIELGAFVPEIEGTTITVCFESDE